MEKYSCKCKNCFLLSFCAKFVHQRRLNWVNNHDLCKFEVVCVESTSKKRDIKFSALSGSVKRF